MTVEAGALSLRIFEVGGEKVLSTLNAIDAKAKAIGQATQSVKFNTPNASAINGQLGQMSVNFTKVGQAATAAAPAIDKVSAAQTNAAKAGASAAAQLGQQLLGYYSITQVVSAAVRIFDEFNDAADRQANAQRRLGATAAYTGESLGTIKTIAAETQRTFKLSTGDAASLTAAFSRLAFMSGNVGQTGKLMTAWMDMAASQGLTLDQVMVGVNSTIAGQDEGLNRLGLMNPSSIWKKWAESLGTTVGKMTDQQKFQAIINEVTAEGAKNIGEYGRYLETAQGQQQAFNSALEQFNAHVGEAGFGVRSWAYSIGTTLVDAFVSADQWLDRMAEKSSTWIAILLTGKPWRAVDPLASDPTTDAAIAGMNAAIAKGKVKAGAPARSDAAAKRAENERQRALERVPDLGNIPLADLTNTKPGRSVPESTVGVDSKGKMKGVSAFSIADVVDKELDALMAKMKAKKQQLADLAMGVAGSIAGALADGFTAAFAKDDDKNFFEAFGTSLLASLGNIVIQLGTAMLTYGLIASTFSSLLIFTPFAGITAGAGASIAAGIGLIALGAGMGAIASNSGGGGGGGSAGGKGNGGGGKNQDNAFAVAFDPDHKLRKQGSAVSPSSRSLDSTPMPEARPVVQIGTINSLHPDDAKWQRAVAETVNNATGRGLIRRPS